MRRLTEEEHLREIDRPIYRREIAPYLPRRIFDSHVHLLRRSDYLPDVDPKKLKTTGPRPMTGDFTHRHLCETMSRLFPARQWDALVFHFPSPFMDLERGNRWIASIARRHANIHALMIPTPDMKARDVEAQIKAGGFVGLKPYPDLARPRASGEVRVGDFLTREHMQVAAARGLVVVLHVPGKERIAGRATVRAVAGLCERYPAARIVLAHVGRSYGPHFIEQAIATLKDLPNLHFDVAALDDAETIEVVLENATHRRLLYGSDLPITLVRGRHLCVNRHCFFLTERPCPNSISPPRGSEFPMTFMLYETVRAVLRACRKRRLPPAALEDIFYGNAARLIGMETEKRRG